MSELSELRCTGEPISWLRLERYASQRSDARITEHVATCAACRACLEEITRDVVALPPLAVPAAVRRAWWKLALPIGGALAAAVAILLLVVRPREPAITDHTRIKGVGEVVVDVVRERDGVIRDDVRTFAPGDRWKVIVTCGLPGTARVDIEIREHGMPQIHRPLATAQIVCGNRIALPGAFTVSGGMHRVCARIASTGDAGTACVTLQPE
jgi:hypothetical protein